MPFLLAAMRGWLAALWLFLPALIIKLLVTFGVGAAVYVGFGALIDGLTATINAQLGGVSAQLLAVLSISGALDGMSMIVSAYGIRLAMAGLTASGALARWRFTPPVGANGQWNLPGV